MNMSFLKKWHSITVIVLVLYMSLIISCQSMSTFTQTKQETLAKNESVHEMILTGKIQEARQMFMSKTDIEATDANGNTALHLAAQINAGDLTAFLIFRGANMEALNNAFQTPLQIAVQSRAVNSITILAEQGADIFPVLDGLTNKELLRAVIQDKSATQTDEGGNSVLHFFVLQENIHAVDVCIEKGISLSEKNKNGQSALEVAYKNTQSLKSIRIASKLILGGAQPMRAGNYFFEDAVKMRNPSMRFEESQTPLHIAAKDGKTGMVEYFLENGAQAQLKDASGSTALHQAVRGGHTAIVRLLIAAGADTNAKDSTGNTPLLLIIPQAVRTDIFDVLLAGGADPNAKDIYGDSPLHIAALLGSEITVLEKLIQAGADINDRNKKGITPLASAVERNWSHQITYYVSKRADIHAEDIEGNTPLSRAITLGVNTVSLLLSQDTIASRDSYGNTVLHVAVNRKSPIEIVQVVLTKKPEIDARNRYGETPLYIAVRENYRVIGETLLAKGADVFTATVEDSSPLQLALTHGGERQEWILTSEVIKNTDGVGNTPLHYAAQWNLDNALAYIIEKGGKIDAKNANGETALFNAVKGDSESTIQLLISKGANKDARDYLGNTPLHASVRWSAPKAASALIKSKASINAQNISGKTPLAEAARVGKMSFITLLLNAKADINASDATGITVLMEAIKSGKAEAVKALLEYGASPAIQEMYGRNAYHEAAATGNIELITFIRNAGGNPLSRDLYGKTPFSLVLDKPITVILTTLGNDKNLIDSDGNTPIHIAVQDRASTEVLQALVSNGYPVNRRNRHGITPLLSTTRSNMTAHAGILLTAGADPFITDNAGNSALSIALKNNNEILTAIVRSAANKTDIAGDAILHYAAREANLETLQQLLAMGLDRTAKNIAGETPYDMAIRWKRPEIAVLLK